MPSRRARPEAHSLPRRHLAMQVKRIAGWVLVALLPAAHVDVAAAGVRAPLVAAVRSRDAAAVSVLLTQPSSVNVAEADGTTALHVATDLDDLPPARLLVGAGAQV